MTDDPATPDADRAGSAVTPISTSAHIACDQAEIARLAALSPLDYHRERKDGGKRLGVGLTALDAIVSEFRPEAKPAARRQRTSLGLPEPEPWPEPVDGATLISELVEAIRGYVIMEPGAAEAVAMWVIHAHAIEAFHISPRLAITSPEKGSGKTTTLDMLAALVPRPLPTANATPAVLFRTIDAEAPTLLIDEADTFLPKNTEIRGILNSGHRRATAWVMRLVGDDHEPQSFSTWCATAIAAIGRLPDTLEDRSIPVRLRRRRQDEKVTSLRAGRTPDLDVLARKSARWAADHTERLSQADPEMPEGLYGRRADNWAPLVAIADEAGGEWPQRARDVALALAAAGSSTDNNSIRVQLLEDVRTLFDAKSAERLPSAVLASALRAMEGRPWAEWKGAPYFSPNTLARLLRDFGIGPHNMKIPNKGKELVLKGYLREQFEDAWARYLPPPPA